MENEFFQSTGSPAMHIEPMFWPSLASSLEILPAEQNLGQNQTQDSFLWEKSTEQSVLDSTLTSLVSSPAASNSNLSGGGDSFMFRELIGNPGNTGNCCGDIFNGNGIGSFYGTPMSSPPHPPPKKMNLPAVATSMTPLADFSGYHGFAERAARLSCFGRTRFNDRISPFAVKSNNNGQTNGSDCINGSTRTLGSNSKRPRVSSGPSLKAIGSQMCKNNNNTGNEESTISGKQIRGGRSGPKISSDFSRKRKSKENSSASASTSPNNTKAAEKAIEASGSKRGKASEENGKKADCRVKTEEEEKGNEKQSKAKSNKPPEPPKDYIRVKARRGQATDSHSLAERARREKIGERMKLLQDLVPGCNKVAGKALMLDEIINYVQSLQRQVEFLSMKLASVNTRLDFNVDALTSKDILQLDNSINHQTVPYQSSIDPLDTSALTRSFIARSPHFSQFTDGASQCPSFCGDDLRTIGQIGLGFRI